MNLNAVLTRRESQIAEYLAWGCCKKEIASLLFISVRTVENTCRSIYDKAEVTKVNELSAWYFCTHFNISLNLSPVKRAMVLALLMIMMPAELKPTEQISRRLKATTIQLSSIRSKRRETDFYSNQFIYES